MYSKKKSTLSKKNKYKIKNIDNIDIKILQETSMSKTWNNNQDKVWDKL